jgi:geranylgeranyl diphosphate synthase type II
LPDSALTTSGARAYLSHHAGTVERELERLLPSDASGLAEAMRYATLGAGKRVRPTLVLAACECCGAPSALALPAACALEMIHNYSLVHDDLPAMDNDDLRRGRPTVHRAFGEAEALLAGDALLTLAFEVISAESLAAGVPSERIVALVAELARAAGVAGMCGGQALELACERSQTDSGHGQTASGHDQMSIGPDKLREISVRKTGALFRAAARLGGIAAGASAEQLAALTEYGEAFGDAFQITDDLLDMGQDQQRAALPTYVTVLGVDGARAQAAARAGQAKTALAAFGERAAHLTGIMDIMMSRRE